jgi:hypothetical protein
MTPACFSSGAYHDTTGSAQGFSVTPLSSRSWLLKWIFYMPHLKYSETCGENDPCYGNNGEVEEFDLPTIGYYTAVVVSPSE